MNECIGLMGKIFGHNFESRYTTIETLKSDCIPPDHVILAYGGKIMDNFKDITEEYHSDVCTRCGMIINRNKE